MTTEANVFYAEFPRAVRGYAPNAVDDFVRQIGERLEALQAQLDEQTARADRLEKELSTAKSNLFAFAEKEAAIANALVATEQRRVGVERELENRRAEAEAQAAQFLDEARQEAENIVNEARQRAEEITNRALEACAAQEERLRALYAEYQDTADRIREALEAHLSLLPPPGTAHPNLATPNGVAVTTTVERSLEPA